MIVSDSPYLEPHLRGFRSFLGLGDLPPLDDHIKYGARYDVQAMRTDKYLLAIFPDFGARWERARQVSADVNAIAHEPEAATLVAEERSLNDALLESIKTIAREAQRDKRSKATRDAVHRASDHLNWYGVEIANKLQAVRNVIAGRVRAQDEARRIAAEADAQRQRAAVEAARVEAATSAAVATVKETQVAVDTRALVTEQLSTQKLIAKAVAPRFLGIPVAYWGVGVAVVGAGAFIYRRKKRRR